MGACLKDGEIQFGWGSLNNMRALEKGREMKGADEKREDCTERCCKKSYIGKSGWILVFDFEFSALWVVSIALVLD